MTKMTAYVPIMSSRLTVNRHIIEKKLKKVARKFETRISSVISLQCHSKRHSFASSGKRWVYFGKEAALLRESKTQVKAKKGSIIKPIPIKPSVSDRIRELFIIFAVRREIGYGI